MLPIVQDAIARDCKLKLLDPRADGESGVRTVDPFGIVAKQGIWYLVARAPAGMRTYRISRMQATAVVLAVTFERPANFDLATHSENGDSAAATKARAASRHLGSCSRRSGRAPSLVPRLAGAGSAACYSG